MQSKESIVCQTPTTTSENGSLNKNENSVQSEPKKLPPKPPKRVSFISTTKDKQNVSSDILIKNNTSEKSDNNVNDKNIVRVVPEKLNNNLIQTDKNSNHLTSIKNNLSPAENCDKIKTKSLETAVSIANQKVIVQEKTVTRTSSVKQLKSEFVKTNETNGTNIQRTFSWNNPKLITSSSKEQSDPQSRLSESQSKIAKLQQSLPTKLSEATVQSLKNKYSPSSFGYPKTFSKTTNDSKPHPISKIPSLIPKSPSILKNKASSEAKENQKTEIVKGNEISVATDNKVQEGIDNKKVENVETADEKQLINKSTKSLENKTNNTSLLSKKDNLPESPTKPEPNDRKTFRTELYITPEIDIDKKRDEKIQTPIIQVIETSDIVKKTKEELPKSECIETVIIEDDDSDTVTLSDDSANSQKVNDIPDYKNTETSSSNLTLTETITTEEMEDGAKKPTKKRSNSFRRIFSFGSTKDKKKTEEPKTTKNGIKKKDGQSDNIENENVFDRNAPQRHTFSGHPVKNEFKPGTYSYHRDDRYNKNTAIYVNQSFENNRLNSSLPVNMKYPFSSAQEPKISERERLNMNTIQYDLYLAQQTNKRLNSSLNMPVNSSRADEYVCMDMEKQKRNDLTQPGFINSHAVNKYIDTTSSSSTCTDSDSQNNLYENALSRQMSELSQESSATESHSSASRIPQPRNLEKQFMSNGEKFYERPKYSNSPEMFTTNPRRARDPQLIKPKAIIPINTERSLPNPYRNNKEGETSDNVYGNIFKPQSVNDQRENIYGKPVPAVRKQLNVDVNYHQRTNQDYNDDDLYGTVYDSLSPVGAQLKITKTNIIRTQNKNIEKLQSSNTSPIQKPMSPTGNKPIERPMSPIEGSKLKLLPNREKLEARVKSPIDDKLKGKKKEMKKDEIDNLIKQNLENEIDYADNNINEESKKETPEKTVFPFDTKQEAEPTSPKRQVKLQRSSHVSPNRPTNIRVSPRSSENFENAENPRVTYVRSPVTVRTESPVSVASSYSIQSSSSSKLPLSTEDLKDLKSTEVYFWEQTNKLLTPKSEKPDTSPDQSPEQVLTQVVVHQQPPVSPKKSETSTNPGVPQSPQKQQNLKNLEAFYWQEIKKLKEKEEQEIFNQQVRMLGRNNSMNLPQAVAQQYRSRSMSPAVNRQRDKRSLSLPRDMQPQRGSADIYGYTRKPEIIQEERIQTPNQSPQYGVVRIATPQQNSNFVRGTAQRNTIGSISTQKQNEFIYENYFPGVELRHQAKSVAPIFKRGSLTQPSRESPPQGNKKVSFSSAQSEDVPQWPTKNGFTQSPPTRRVEKKTDNIDDEVFYQNTSAVVENEMNLQQQQSPNRMSEPPYGTTQQKLTEVRIMNRTEVTEPDYITRKVFQNPRLSNKEIVVPNMDPQKVQSPPYVRQTRSISVEPLYISGKPPQYPTQEPIYVTKSNITNEQIYGRTKQVTVTNKVCDMYGQIHEQSNIYGNIQKSGVIYGQLQQNPIPGSPVSRNQGLNRSDPSFVRGTRLTSSFSDMRSEAPRRPLPPTPREKLMMSGKVIPVVSESESGSEAGEVQRILERRELNRRIGMFYFNNCMQ